MTAPHKVAFPARCAVNICYDKHLCSQVFPAGIPVEGFFEGMVELFDADLKRKGFDGVALPAGSYELHKINGVRLDINKSLDELGVQDGDTLVLVPRVAGESFAALGLAVALVVPATRFRPIIRLTVEWLEVLAMIALLPAAAALGGLFAWLRH